MSDSSFKQISLADWQLVKVSGADNQKYLQGQLTVDINDLDEQSMLFAAHCDAKGKMWSNLLLFKRGHDIFYIVRKSVIEKQIAELKKYAVFAKVAIDPVQDLHMVGLAGDALPNEILSKLESQSCCTENNITYLKLPLPTDRVIMITPQPLDEELLPCDEWLLLDLDAGYAIIDAENMESLLPQACNLQLYDAISFDKGCYCGQEMVARAQFRGANKRGLYLLSGESEVLPIIGDTLEYQIGDNWRESGQVLAALKLKSEEVYIQVVLNNGIDIQTLFRVKGLSSSQLTFC